MTLYEEKKKVFAMIEELNPESEYLTDDPDLKAKVNEVFNQVMYELARMKKIYKYCEVEVTEGEMLRFVDIESKCGGEVYQITRIGGVNYQSKANGTVFKILESGTAEIECCIYPERITDKTKDKAYEFELSPDVLEILPYGVAADLLRSDVSAEYGAVYATRYESMLSRLDPRYQTGFITYEGGVNF